MIIKIHIYHYLIINKFFITIHFNGIFKKNLYINNNNKNIGINKHQHN